MAVSRRAISKTGKLNGLLPREEWEVGYVDKSFLCGPYNQGDWNVSLKQEDHDPGCSYFELGISINCMKTDDDVRRIMKDYYLGEWKEEQKKLARKFSVLPVRRNRKRGRGVRRAPLKKVLEAANEASPDELALEAQVKAEIKEKVGNLMDPSCHMAKYLREQRKQFEEYKIKALEKCECPRAMLPRRAVTEERLSADELPSSSTGFGNEDDEEPQPVVVVVRRVPRKRIFREINSHQICTEDVETDEEISEGLKVSKQSKVEEEEGEVGQSDEKVSTNGKEKIKEVGDGEVGQSDDHQADSNFNKEVKKAEERLPKIDDQLDNESYTLLEEIVKSICRKDAPLIQAEMMPDSQNEPVQTQEVNGSGLEEAEEKGQIFKERDEIQLSEDDESWVDGSQMEVDHLEVTLDQNGTQVEEKDDDDDGSKMLVNENGEHGEAHGTDLEEARKVIDELLRKVEELGSQTPISEAEKPAIEIERGTEVKINVADKAVSCEDTLDAQIEIQVAKIQFLGAQPQSRQQHDENAEAETEEDEPVVPKLSEADIEETNRAIDELEKQLVLMPKTE